MGVRQGASCVLFGSVDSIDAMGSCRVESCQESREGGPVCLCVTSRFRFWRAGNFWCDFVMCD